MTFPKIKKHLTQSGDTLIEVMVVLTVLGFAIAISYATANRGLLNVRQAEENSSATEKVQSQVENLRALLASSTNDKSNLPAFNDPKNIFGPTTAFCIPDVNATPTIITPSASVDASVPNDLSTPCSFGSSTDFPARILIYNCDFDTTANSPCAGLTGPDTFVVKATWEDVAGDGVDSSTQIYRLHPPTVVSASASITPTPTPNPGPSGGAKQGGSTCDPDGCGDASKGLFTFQFGYLNLLNLSYQVLKQQQLDEIDGCTWQWIDGSNVQTDTGVIKAGSRPLSAQDPGACYSADPKLDPPGHAISHTFCTDQQLTSGNCPARTVTVILTEHFTNGTTYDDKETYQIPTQFFTCLAGDVECHQWQNSSGQPCDPNLTSDCKPIN